MVLVTLNVDLEAFCIFLIEMACLDQSSDLYINVVAEKQVSTMLKELQLLVFNAIPR
jgi:hypothetical protein